MPNVDVETIIYLYLFICGLLLLFNALYMISSGGRHRWQALWERYWRAELTAQLRNMALSFPIYPRHFRLLEKRLRRLGQMIAYCNAAEAMEREFSKEAVHAYFLVASPVFQSLASYYGKRDSMERAYFAWFIARFSPHRSGQNVFREIVIGYLENATVFCRENTLRALYASGEVEAVEIGLQFMQDREIFHHPKLLADGLSSFAGDKEELARRLWGHASDWNSVLVTAVVQFITDVSDRFQASFFQVLTEQKNDLEVHLAIIRYFRKHPYTPAREVLQRFAQGEDTYAVVAAFALDQYPGEDTVYVLKKALCSRNWYVRYNAAVSLLHLNVGEDVLADILQGGDRYAKEMLEYQMQRMLADREEKENGVV